MIGFKDRMIGAWHVPQLFLFCNWQLTARLPINLTCMPLAHGNKAIAISTERLHRLESGRRVLYCQKCSL
jgi:hypothetical protein